MDAGTHPAEPFVPVLKDLAEGRLAPQEWLAWWDAHSAELKSVVPPGWHLRLKPPGESHTLNRRLAASAAGASFVLGQLGIAHMATDKYQRAAEVEFQEFCAARERLREQRKAAFRPAIAAIHIPYPKFARLLTRRSDLITELLPGATDDELVAMERSLGLNLPASLKTLLHASRHIQLEAFALGTFYIFTHELRSGAPSPSDGMLNFGDCWLEADGDQMLFDPRDLPADDPPVYYYAHEVPEVRPLRKSFSAWLESLGRSPLFRD